jgi:hypothetical protein
MSSHIPFSNAKNFNVDFTYAHALLPAILWSVVYVRV